MLVVGEEHLVQRVGFGDEPGHDQRRVVAGGLELVRQDGEPLVKRCQPGARCAPRQHRQVEGLPAQDDADDAGEDVGRGARGELGRPEARQLGVRPERGASTSGEADADPGASPEPHEEAQGQRQSGCEEVRDHDAVARIRIRQGEVDSAFASMRPAST